MTHVPVSLGPPGGLGGRRYVSRTVVVPTVALTRLPSLGGALASPGRGPTRQKSDALYEEKRIFLEEAGLPATKAFPLYNDR